LQNPTTLLNHSFTPSLQTLQTLNNQTHHSFSSQIPKTHIHFCKLTTTTTHFAIKSIATRTTHLQQNFIAPKSISNNNPLQQNPFQQDPIATTTTTTHLQQTHCNKIHLETTHDTLSDADDAAAAPGVQFNLNDQVFQIFTLFASCKRTCHATKK
jgi:predicted patatin/cPLA2 family phospholipase